MSFLPDIADGKIVPGDDDAQYRLVFEMMTPMQKAAAERRVVNDGWTLKKAIEEQGIISL